MLRGVVSKTRSVQGIVQSAIDIKKWLEEVPGVHEVRPARCTLCRAPSRRPGHTLGIHGHGLVRRDVWGPVEEGETPEFWDLLIRRYRCLTCLTIIRVGPRGILPRRRYGGGAIAAALALWAVFGQEPAVVRDTVSPWRHVAIETQTRWASLGRWAFAVGEGHLWPLRRRLPDGLPAHVLAATAVRALVARLPQSTMGPLRLAEVYGAAHGERGRV